MNHAHAHHHGLGFFFGILLSLLALTGLTYVTARVWSNYVPDVLHVPLALTIALVKAGLVAWFFMHLNAHAPVNRAYFVLALCFVALMMTLIVGDAMTRLPTAEPNFPGYQEVRGAP